MSYITDLEIDEEPLKFFRRLQQDGIRGDILVPSFGNGTANTEFEFLTGLSKEFLPDASVPYMQYINQNTNSIVRDLNKLGYKTVAIHPYWEYGYRRNLVYECFGFDNYISAEDLLLYSGDSYDDANLSFSSKETWKRL